MGRVPEGWCCEMRLLRRNTRPFLYKAYGMAIERMQDGRHTGEPEVSYTGPVEYRGTISPPSGFVNEQLFGLDIKYTHVLLMDDPAADIKESGIIIYKDAVYDIKAVRPSINVLAIALEKRTDNNGGELYGG